MKRQADQEISQLEEEVKETTTPAINTSTTGDVENKKDTAESGMKDYKGPKTRVAIIVGYNGCEFSGS